MKLNQLIEVIHSTTPYIFQLESNRLVITEKKIEKKEGIFLNIRYIKKIPSAFYTHLKSLDDYLILYELSNNTDNPLSIRIETEISGLTQKSITRGVVDPYKQAKIEHIPPFLNNVDLTSNSDHQIHYKVYLNNQLKDEQTLPVFFYSNDIMHL